MNIGHFIINTMISVQTIYKLLPRMIQMMEPQAFLKLRTINRVWLYMFRLLEPSIYINRCKTSIQKATVFTILHNWVSKQGSKEWLSQRNGSYSDFTDTLISEIYGQRALKQVAIGGSEIASVLGENPYSSRRKLAKQKLGLSVFRGSIDTRWGKIFEPMLTMYTEYYFNTTITEMGSIPGVRKYGKAISSYSPDGVAIVNTSIISEKLQYFTEPDSEGNTVVLFEFKCPRRRIPNGKIPGHYISQPKKGMCILPMCNMGIFGDAMFRKCSIDDFNMSDNYDKAFHDTDKYAKISKPVVLGMIGFYEPIKIVDWQHEISNFPINIYDPTNPNPYKIPLIVDYIYSQHKPSNSEIINIIKSMFSNLSGEFISMISYCIQAQKLNTIPGIDYGLYNASFEEMVEQAVDNGFNIWYPDTFTNSGDLTWLESQFSAFSSFCETNFMKPIGVMPWKLFKVHFMLVTKDPNYINKVLPDIEKIVNDIQEVYSGKSINTVFPKSADDHKAYKKYVQKYKTPKNIIVNLPQDSEPLALSSWFTSDEFASI